MKASCVRSYFFVAILSLSLAARGQSASKTQNPGEKTEKEATVETAAALSKAPTCDGALIDELQIHITGIRCLTYFDHDCARIWATVASMSASVVAGGTGTFAYFKERGAKKSFAKARSALASEIAEKGSDELKDKFSKALSATDDVIDGKYLNSEQMRARALRSLESMAASEGIQSSKIRAASMAAAKLGSIQGIRTAGMIGTGIAVLTGPVGTAAMFVLDSTRPAGQKCVSDNGLEFVDKRPTEDGKSCEFAFDLNGPRFRSFFKQDRESQLRVLKNHPEICEYMKLFNEALKGNLLTELQMLNKAEFKTLPVCKAAQGGGVEYDVDFTGRSFHVSTNNDQETKKKVRAITLSGLSQRGGYDGEMTIRFMDEAAGSSPYLISRKNARGETLNHDFQSFLSNAVTDRRFENAVKVLNLSQFWTPIVGACCQDHDKEKDRENCFRDKLPGLKLEQIEAEKKESTGAAEEHADAAASSGQK